MFVKSKSAFLLFCVFLSLNLTVLQAQNRETDSLEFILKSTPDQPGKVDELNRLSYSIYSSLPVKTEYYAQQALTLSKKLKYKKGEAQSYYLIGVALTFQDKYAPAIDAEISAIQKAQKIKNYELVARAYNAIGLCNSRLGKNERAMKAYEKALEVIAKAEDQAFSAAIIHNIGSLYVKMKMYDKGLQYFRKSIDLDSKNNHKQWLAQNFYEIGLTYFKLKNYPEALNYTFKTLNIAASENYFLPQAKSLRLLGLIYTELKATNQAEKYFLRGLKLANDKGLKRENLELLQSYSALLEHGQHYKKALALQRQYENIYKSLYNEANSKQIAETQIKFQARQKELENNLLKKDQQLKNQLLISTLILLGGLVIFSVILFIKNRSIREKNRLQQLQYVQIQNQKEKVEELNKIKDKLFSIISHDLRSPFATLKSMIELYDEEMLTKEDTDMFLKQIGKDVDSINNLIDNLLFWSKSQMQGFFVNPKPVLLKKIFDDVAVLHKNSISEKNISIKNSIADDCFAFADYEMVKVIARNLVGNAIKFTPENGTIQLEASIKENELEISVADSGIGIAEDKHEQLFKGQFYTTKGLKNEKGTGLGLLLCKEFIEKNNGRLWVESEKQKGSTFYFTLPINSNEIAGNSILPATTNAQNVTKSSFYPDQEEEDDDLEQLNDVHDQYQLLVKATNGAVYNFNLKSRRLTWNEALYSHFGYPEEVTDIEWWRIRVHPDDLDEMEESLANAIKNNQANWKHEYRFLCADGNYKHVSDRGLFIFDEKGEAERMIGIMENIQEQKDSSAEMLRLSLVARNVTNLVVITDQDDCVVWVNNAFEKHTGYQLKEIIGKKPKDFLSGEETNAKHLAALDIHVFRKEAYSAEIVNYTKDKRPYWVQIDCTPYIDPLSGTTGFVAIQSIITDRKEKETLILKKNAALREIARISSHEVRSPLSSILGLIILLQEKNNEKEFSECLNLLKVSSKQLDEVIFKIHDQVNHFERLNG